MFDCYIFNYEIMPATMANTFVFMLQGSALADLRYGGVCNSERVVEIGQYLPKLCSNGKGFSFFDSQCSSL